MSGSESAPAASPASATATPALPAPTPTTADFEAALESMLEVANAAGESFLDVTSKALSTAVSGPKAGSKGLASCCRLMRRMMIPGDHELSTKFGGSRTSLLIRFRLPR